jgi:ectoine hydroxylase-related dioxygenase (phytanoyl-CoA dioxygenase family)
MNKPLYKKFGVNKSVLGSISHKDIKNPSAEIPWLDLDNAVEKLKNHHGLATFPLEWREQLLLWPERGYMVLKNFADEKKCDQISAELEKLISSGEVDLDYTDSRVMNAWKNSATIKNFIHEKLLIDFLSFTLGREVVPFQTLSFFKGSNQETHSDSIHMTTEPLGYLIATWTALEDITSDSGPLHYFPGSHKLPYVMGENFPHDSSAFAVDDDLYEKYEKKIGEMIEEKKIKKEIFLANKGDLLVWHANILHGGEKVTNENATRKSLVTHYFCKGDVICYHEITQRPAVLPV